MAFNLEQSVILFTLSTNAETYLPAAKMTV